LTAATTIITTGTAAITPSCAETSHDYSSLSSLSDLAACP
jgi:hypothetical protein